MSRRMSFTEQRRRKLARRVDALERLESRNMIMDGLFSLSPSAVVPFAAAVGTWAAGEAVRRSVEHRKWHEQPHATAASTNSTPVLRRYDAPIAARAVTLLPIPVGKTTRSSETSQRDWLTLIASSGIPDEAPRGALTSSGNSARPSGAGLPLTNRGGVSPHGTIMPWRVPPPAASDDTATSANQGMMSTTLITASHQPVSPTSTQTTVSPGTAAPSATNSGGAPDPRQSATVKTLTSAGTYLEFKTSDVTDPIDTIIQDVLPPTPLGGSARPTFTNFPLYVLDYNRGVTLFPDFVQSGDPGGDVDLRAQVRDTTVSSYSWDTTNLTGATNITGTSTYRLQFKWQTEVQSASNSSVTLTVTDTNNKTEIQTYTFYLRTGSGSGSGATTWPTSLAPNLVLPNGPTFSSHYVTADANSGALETTLAMPGYNPNLPPLVVEYHSLAADPRPLIVVHHELDSAQAVPSKTSAQLTFNGTAGSTYYYDTSKFTAGDIGQFSLQVDATGLSTGRYSYTVTVADYRASTTTTTYSNTATVIKESDNPIGSGWTLQGLNRITTATGGVILNVGGGESLWFSGSSPYTSPAGDFSTLVQNGDSTYTRTMPDGTKYNFDTNGRETALIDRNGLRVTYAYDGSGKLSTITDPYSKITTFSYDGSGKLQTITDTASRVTTISHTGSNLTSLTLPDSAVWNYAYDGSGRMTTVTDPRSKIVTVAYDSANRVGTITRPDNTTETFKAFQLRGYDTSGTSASPAPATLLAEARATYTDPLSNVTDLRVDWRGMGQVNGTVDPAANLTTYDRDANGLATVTIDRLNRVGRDEFDASGNVTKHTYPDGKTEQYTYNSFSEPTTHTDPRVKTTTYTYDSSGNLTVIEDPLHNLTTMTYTSNGRRETVKDARNNVTTNQYDNQDRLTTIIYPGSPTKKFAYDSKGNQTTVTDERGNSTTLSYDALNRKTGMKDALNNRTTYTFESGGNLTKIDAPLSRTTSLAYDSMNRVTTITDPLSHNAVFVYDSGGNLTKLTDSLSRITTYQYDQLNRRTVVIDPLSNRTTTTFDAEGQVTKIADRLNRVTTITYNVRGWKSTVKDPLGNTITYTYTATGKPETVIDPVNPTLVLVSYTYDDDDRLIELQDQLNDRTTSVYDAVGNVTAKVDANSNRNTYSYDSRNRLETVKDALSNVTTYQYDDAGNRTVVIDPLTHRTTSGYDALNRVTTITDARSGQTTISYDAAGRRTGLTDPVNNRTTWSYDAADRLTTMTDALGTATYSYDSGNQLVDRTDRAARRTTFAYDSGGRQTNERWLDSSGGTIRTITSTYDAEAQLTGVTDPDATLTFSYDSGGREVTAQTSSSAGQPNVTLTSGFDATADRTSLTDDLSSVGRTTYTFDGGRRLTRITRSLGGVAGPQIDFGYDNGNRRTSETRTIDSAYPKVLTTYSYDAADRVTTITHGKVTWDTSPPPPHETATALATYVYGYDVANRVTTETINSSTVTYSYDDTNQLTSASGGRTESYGYDLNGNRNTTGYTVATGNKLSASPVYTYTYDAEGNLNAKTETATNKVTTFSYDHRNRLTGATQKDSGGNVIMQSTYTYDALNRRIGTKVDDDGAGPHSPVQTWLVLDGQNTYADFNGAGTLQQRYLHGLAIDELLARMDSGGTTAWYLPDKLGTIRDIVTSSGSSLYNAVYDSFGKVSSETGAGGDRFKFTGREYDSETGNYYVRARYYDPTLGRFLGQDPIRFDAGDANLYRYVGNGPVNATDPIGLEGDSGRSQEAPWTDQEPWWQVWAYGMTSWVPDLFALDIHLQNFNSEWDTKRTTSDLDTRIQTENSKSKDGQRSSIRDQAQRPIGQSTGHIIVSAEKYVAGTYGASFGMVGPAKGGMNPGARIHSRAASNPERGRFDTEHSGSRAYDKALGNARKNAGDLGPHSQKMYDPQTGTLIGEQSSKRGWRIDNDHVNWWDWSSGKKGTGGTYGHEYFPPEQSGPHSKYGGYAPWQ